MCVKVDVWGGGIPCRTGESSLRRRRVSPILYQLSHIPSHSLPGWTTSTSLSHVDVLAAGDIAELYHVQLADNHVAAGLRMCDFYDDPKDWPVRVLTLNGNDTAEDGRGGGGNG